MPMLMIKRMAESANAKTIPMNNRIISRFLMYFKDRGMVIKGVKKT